MEVATGVATVVAAKPGLVAASSTYFRILLWCWKWRPASVGASRLCRASWVLAVSLLNGLIRAARCWGSLLGACSRVEHRPRAWTIFFSSSAR